ncbi:GTP-binding protein HflX [Rhodoblastus acidophilus]|uniref:GTPase HflX n=1 Tax=Rhodoblastus acidophilus TaxID=1074 RepID=A0A212QJJ5_RHOAC|nr:GTPase HflX [Rhodoblastus acidophilus]PPQ39961.1 GTPase HflX [Rhodoblastus acidophilus]RAI23265.1 GTPase HflX [Rhodoblastus acidophilus]SNB59518.1 GTP-binding protein HflX [Rhodoblastus acidophilus]
MSTTEVFGGEACTRNSDRTRALVLGPYLTDRAATYADGAKPLRAPEARLDEAEGLALAIDVELVGRELVLLSQIRPATYIGKGKVEEIAALAKEREAELVVVDCALSPVQQRNLEKAFSAKVIDRTGLILEIFGERARTKEGALQVELAHLAYQKSRLVRSWTHLERQRGGFGFLGGPGETQIETDRRLIQERMTRIERDLDQVKRTRGLHRKSRRDVPFPIVALVGYTNAGKSSLFNRLTKADVFAKDLLFATLDPTLRGLKLPHGGRIILSDTVGFISDLPHMLVSAFRATLEEVLEADVILHVRDISHEDAEAQGADVEKILGELGIDSHDPRLIEVWNKTDLLPPEERDRLRETAARKPRDERPCAVSALTGDGIDILLDGIEARLGAGRALLEIRLDAADGEGQAWLYAHTEVLKRQAMDDGAAFQVRVAPDARARIERRFPQRLRDLN